MVNWLDLIWLLFLLLLFLYFGRDWAVLRQMKSWSLTRGYLTEFSWVQEGQHLWPKIKYSYQANGEEYQNEYFFLEVAHHTPNSKYARKLAYRIAVAYQKNEAIDVYFNPNNPQQAVLDVAIPRKLRFILVLLLALIVLHLVIVGHRFL